MALLFLHDYSVAILCVLHLIVVYQLQLYLLHLIALNMLQLYLLHLIVLNQLLLCLVYPISCFVSYNCIYFIFPCLINYLALFYLINQWQQWFCRVLLDELNLVAYGFFFLSLIIRNCILFHIFTFALTNNNNNIFVTCSIGLSWYLVITVTSFFA